MFCLIWPLYLLPWKFSFEVVYCSMHIAVHLEGRCGDRLFDSRDVRFIVGEGEDKGIPLGVDRAMEKMQKGECCVIYLKSK